MKAQADIPVAEEAGLIAPIGEWALRTACAEAASWPDGVTVAVNVSPAQFREQTLALTVVGALGASGISARRLAIEITEAVLMRNNDTTMATLHQLRDLGVQIVMDDFGTGYSSLSYALTACPDGTSRMLRRTDQGSGSFSNKILHMISSSSTSRSRCSVI